MAGPSVWNRLRTIDFCLRNYSGQFLFTLRFCQKSAERMWTKKCFFFIFRFDVWPTHIHCLYMCFSAYRSFSCYNIFKSTVYIHHPLFPPAKVKTTSNDNMKFYNPRLFCWILIFFFLDEVPSLRRNCKLQIGFYKAERIWTFGNCKWNERSCSLQQHIFIL